MSFGLNNQIALNVPAFLGAHAVTTAMLSSIVNPPPAGSSNYDLLRSENFPADPGVILIPRGGSAVTDGPLMAYWLPQGGHIDVPHAAPPTNFIFTPELSGCKIYVDQLNAVTDRIFHIQCPHEATEYTAANQGIARRATIDSRHYGGAPSTDGPPVANRVPTTRATVLMHFGGGAWNIHLQGLTGIGPGLGHGGTRLMYPPGPNQAVNGVLSVAVP